MVDTKGEKVGEVANLTSTGDKPKFKYMWSFKMKDDTQK